jgi:predicted DCC family thiol-disulfide oxidoreductase YuxK
MQVLPETVLFFDGLCGLCDHLVQFLLRRDPHGRIFFVPIQSDLGRKVLLERGVPEAELLELSTVYFIKNGTLYRRSRAVFQVLSCLPAPWGWAKLLLLIPSVIADPLYRAVAGMRYRIFGRLDQCRIPSQEEKRRFL